ncbi:MAG: DUF748 domain-containing protein [Planctomycetes bacterium]|nr:DUF748 domain-containing protein [Planctomycetota bacterium]
MNELLRAVWKRRWARIGIVVAGSACALRLLLALATPLALDLAASARGLSCDYDSWRLSLLLGELEVHGLQVRERAAPAGSDSGRRAELEYLYADLDVLSVLSARPRLARAELDGLWLRVQRTSDGRWPWLEHLRSQDDTTARETPEVAQGPLDFELPVELGTASAMHLRIELDDQLATPPTQAMVTLNARVVERDSVLHFELSGFSPSLFDALHASGSAELGEQRARVHVASTASALHPRALASQLAELGLRPSADDVSGELEFELALNAAEGGCNGELTLLRCALERDGQPALRIGSATRVEIEQLSARRLELGAARLSEPRLWMRRQGDGAWSFAGFDWIGRATRDEQPSSAAIASADFELALSELGLEDARVSIEDGATEGARELELNVDRGACETLAWPLREPRSGALLLRASAPGIVESIELDGELATGRDRARLVLAVRARGVTLERLQPQLRAAGLSSSLRDGALETGLVLEASHEQQTWTASLVVDGARLADGEELAGVRRVGIEGLQLDPSTLALSIDELSIEHPRVRVARDALGTWHALGLSIQPAPDSGAAPAQPASPAAPSPLAIPRLRCKSGRVSEAHWMLADAAVEPALDELVRVDFEWSELDTSSTDAAPARWSFSSACDGLYEELSAQGTLHAGAAPPHLSLRAALRARGLETTTLAPYLSNFSLEPTLSMGKFAADLSVDVRDTGEALAIDVALERAVLSDADRELASARALRIVDARGRGRNWSVREVALDAPFAEIQREANGALSAFGVRTSLEPRESTAEPAAGASMALKLELPPVAIELAELSGARLRWRDAVHSPELVCEVHGDARLDALRIDADAAPAPFSLSAVVEGALDELAIQGEIAAAADALRVHAELDARGMRAGPLAAYLAPTLDLEWNAASARAEVDASVAAHAQGGIALRADLSRLELADRGQSLAHVERCTLAAARIDPAELVFDVEELSATGIELEVRRSAQGEMHALGMRVARAPDAPQGAPPSENAAHNLPRWSGATPSVRLGKLELGLARLLVRDETLGDGARALEARATLTSGGPVCVLSPRADQITPLTFAARASIDDLVDAFELDVSLAPFSAEGEFAGALRMRGLHGESLASFAPRLAFDASELTAGEAELEFDGQLRLSRRAPLDIDWGQGIAGELHVRRAEVRAQPQGDLLAGIQALDAELARFDPRTGDVRLRSLELSRPALRVRRDARGLQLLGVTLPLSTAGEQPTLDEPEAAPHVPAADAPDFALERLAINGLDVVLRDETGEPPTLVPLTGLALEVKKLSTRALRQGGQVAFQVFVEPGAVELPARVESDSLLEGLAQATAAVLTGQGDEAQREARPLFESASLSGRVGLWPEPSGWAALELTALELGAFRGLASAQGLEIGDGLLDLLVRARLQGADGIAVDSTSSFSHLALSEPADGPISRWLSLPAPLDAVLFALQDAEGRQRIPAAFRVTRDGLSTSAILGAASQAAAVVIARAVASAPLRVVGTLTDAVGVTGGAEEPTTSEPRLAAFAANDVGLEPGARATLEGAARELEDDDELGLVLIHVLSRADIERAALLAQPSPQDCLALVARLRRRQVELARQREQRAAAARVDFALGRGAEAELGAAAVRELERELGRNEDALDRVFEALRPGADKRSATRTRAALLELASERLERAKARLIELGVDAERIEVRPVKAQLEAGESAGGVRLATRRRAS